MSSALSVYILFISLMQSVNGAQFLDTTSSLTLIGFSPACASSFISIQFFVLNLVA